MSFHADRPQGHSDVHPNTSLQAGEYQQLLDLLFRSARLFHPGAACTLLTDAATSLHGSRGAVRRFEVPVDHAELMLSRSLAQLRFVECCDFARPLVLVDADVLLRASLQPVFDEDFDVGLTYRRDADMPINGGLLLLNDRRPDVARRFCRRFVGLYRERHAGDGRAAWYGDQLALRDCVGLDHRQLGRQRIVEADGARILLLPCEVYNFSPDNCFAAIASGLPDKRVLHFKGQRKRLMRPFWDAFLRPRESRLPWAGVLGRRARRRLERSAAGEGALAAGAAAGGG